MQYVVLLTNYSIQQRIYYENARRMNMECNSGGDACEGDVKRERQRQRRDRMA